MATRQPRKVHLGVSSIGHLLSAERSQSPLRMDQLRRPSSLPIGPFVPLPPGTARTAARRVAVGAAASLAVVAVPSVASAALPATPFISEVHYDNVGADVDEFVEVQLPPGTSSAGLKVVLYNGSGG